MMFPNNYESGWYDTPEYQNIKEWDYEVSREYTLYIDLMVDCFRELVANFD